MKYILLTLLVFIAALSTAFAAKHETWTSSVGTQIEGTYIGSTESKHWIASNTGRLFKLSESQLSEKSIERISEINETRKKRESMHIKQSSLMPLDTSRANEELITTLCSSKIPRVNFRAVPISSALESLNEMIESEIPFRLEDGIEDSELNVQLRNMYANEILDFLTQQVGMCYQLEDGEIVIRTING